MTAKNLPAIRKSTALAPTLLPPAIVDGPKAARFAWDEFFSGQVRNRHTRVAYERAVRKLLAWLEPMGVPIDQITPGHVGEYFNQHPGSIPTKKQHLSAVRRFFDVLVNRHAMLLNPAATVRAERYQVVEGKTPEITPAQCRHLLASIKTADNVIGLRDRAIIGILIYTAARAGAVGKLKLQNFRHDGTQYTLRFSEKGGKSREIPVRHDLQGFITEYIEAAGIAGEPKRPLFRSTVRKTKTLTGNGLTTDDVGRMFKRRLKGAALPGHLSPHSCRVATLTDLIEQGVPIEDVQYLAGHADPRTTKLYLRNQKKVTRNIVERISI